MQSVRTLFTLMMLAASSIAIPGMHVQHREHAPRTTASVCFDATDSADIRLWPGAAPGTIGNDPCRDIPFLRVYRAAGSGRVRPASASVSRAEDRTMAFLVLPGGGYDRLTDTKEQEPVAQYLSQQLNVTTFVLYYRLVQPDGTYGFPVPMQDAQRAMRYVRMHAAEFGINPHRIGMLGFSAGGHLASTIALHPNDSFGLRAEDSVDRADARPDMLALGYPVISMEPAEAAAKSSHDHLLYGYSGRELAQLQRYLSGQDNVTRTMPPVFLFESMDDQRIDPQNSVLFANALRNAGVAADIHLFAHGVHGSGLSVGIPDEERWPSMFAAWLQRQ